MATSYDPPTRRGGGGHQEMTTPESIAYRRDRYETAVDHRNLGAATLQEVLDTRRELNNAKYLGAQKGLRGMMGKGS